jgi:hypothetical protein
MFLSTHSSATMSAPHDVWSVNTNVHENGELVDSLLDVERLA